MLRIQRLADRSVGAASSPWLFIGAVLLLLIWSGVALALDLDVVWQWTVGTGLKWTTVLIALLREIAETRQDRAAHLKLDELLLPIEGARSELVKYEVLSEQQRLQLERRP